MKKFISTALQHSLTFIYFLSFAHGLLAQPATTVREVTGSEGNTVGVGSYSVSYTVGEAFIGTGATNSYVLNEGFHLPIFSLVAALDSVWPGDANYDGIADVYDILPMGIAYGSTGPVRANATTTWIPQPAINWTGQFSTGLNYKHADANGDGSVTMADTLPIHLNYGFSHNKTGEEVITGNNLQIDIEEDSLFTGDTMHVNILLGTSTEPIDSLYGLAFSIDFDTTLVDPATLKVAFDNSWVGTPGVDMISMWRAYGGGAILEMGLTRIDQTEQTGYGRIASMSIIMIDDLGGKRELIETFKMTVSRLEAQRADEFPLSLGVRGDSLVVGDTDTKINWLAEGFNWQAYPNPARNLLKVEMSRPAVGEWILSDVLGNQLLRKQGYLDRFVWDLEFLPQGLYFLHMKSNSGTDSKKILVRH
ncbi:MAG: T9SS type A sorting domain-containing protein [Bacteroidia bacterium]